MPSIASRAISPALAATLATSPTLPPAQTSGAPSPDPAPQYGFSPVGNASPYRGFVPSSDSLDSDIGAAYPLAAKMRRAFSSNDSQITEQLLVVESHAFPTSASAGMRTKVLGAPTNVNMVKLAEASYTNSTGTFSKITVTFQRNQADQFWGSAEIWVSGYQGSAAPIYITTIQSSPSSFTLNKTGEIVTVTLVSVSTSGVKVPFSQSPSTVVKLN